MGAFNLWRISWDASDCERLVVAVILTGYAFLAVVFSLGPIFEGPDEVHHFHYIYTLTQTGGLPDPLAADPEYHQAPLYYLLASPLALLVSATDFEDIRQHLNPFSPYAITETGNDNKNIFLHSANEAFPYQQSPTARLVHLIRLLSIGLGLGTVLCSYAVFWLLWPNRAYLRLIALGLVAFWPRFVYLSSTISNDNLLYLLATITLYLLLRYQRDGLTWRSALRLGLVLGCALLTKVSAVFLVFPAGVALLYLLVKDRRTFRFIPVIGFIVIAIAGWWYLHNWIQFGDPTLVSVLPPNDSEIIQGGHLNVQVGLQNIQWAYQTLWGRFGEDRIPLSNPFLNLFDLIVIFALAGIVIHLARSVIMHRFVPKTRPDSSDSAVMIIANPTWRWALIIVVFALAWVGALIYYASTAWNGNQGRYLLPGIGSWAAILAFGLDRWLPRRARLPAALIFNGLLAVVVFIGVFGYFLPAYRVSSLPVNIDKSLAFRFADSAELIGTSPANPKGHPGETIRITLYWRAIAPSTVSLQTYLHTVDSTVVQRDSFPGTGNLLSIDWRPGQTWSETYVVTIPANTDTQKTYSLVAGLYDPLAKTTLTSTDASGQPVTPIIGQIAVNGPAADSNIKKAYLFDGLIGLAEPVISRTENSVKICLNWLPLTNISSDYHEFVHIFGSDKSLIGSVDAQPEQGSYPTTGWSTGESITECLPVHIANKAGSDLTVAIGLYDSQTKERLAATSLDGKPLIDKSVTIRVP